MNLRRILSSTALVVGTVLLSAGLQTFAAFTQPTATPPGNDAYAPLSTSPTAQIKVGGLDLGALTVRGGAVINTGTGIANGLIVQNGNVGIGATNPSQKLVVQSGNPSTAIQIIPYNDASKSASIIMDNEILRIKTAAPNDGGIRFDTPTGNDRMTITRAGDVGIGTASPSQKLDVNGYVKGTGLCIGTDCRTIWPSGGTGGTAGDNLGNHVATQDLNMNLKSIIGGDGTYTPGMGAGSNKIYFGWNSSTGNVVSKVDTTVMPLQRRVDGVCSAGSSIRAIGFDGTVTCQIDNVGTSGTAGDNLGNHVATQDLNMNLKSIINTGNVGIGNTAPQDKLDVTGNARFGLSGSTIRLEAQAGFTRAAFDELRFWDWSGGGDMVTFTNGNVGIGTVSPTQKLDVNGNLRVGNIVGQGWMKINSTGANLHIDAGADNDKLNDLYLNWYGGRDVYYGGGSGAQGLPGTAYIALKTNGDVQAYRFVDMNNGGYYVDPASTSILNSVSASGDISAPKFIDKDNSGYYVDPSQSSKIIHIQIDGTLKIPTGAGANKVFTSDSSGNGTWKAPEWKAGEHCGIYSKAGGLGIVSVNCQGFNPQTSCPVGFTRAGGDFETDATRVFYTCVKN